MLVIGTTSWGRCRRIMSAMSGRGNGGRTGVRVLWTEGKSSPTTPTDTHFSKNAGATGVGRTSPGSPMSRARPKWVTHRIGTREYLAWGHGYSSCLTGEAAAGSGAGTATSADSLPLRQKLSVFQRRWREDPCLSYRLRTCSQQVSS